MSSTELFFKAYYTKMKEFFVEYRSEEFGLTEKNYWDLVLKESKVNEKDFHEIEQQLKLQLPESFKDFYKRHYSLDKDFDTGGLYIGGSQEFSKLEGLKNYLFEQGLSEDILSLKLVPFGLYQDEWYVCLDLNQNIKNPPIVLYEMSSWEKGKEAISHRNWFTNFDKFLECISDYLITGDIINFDRIDTQNNYLKAYNYWL